MLKQPEQFFTSNKTVLLLALTACALWASAFPSIKTGYVLFKIAQYDIPAMLVFAGYRFTLAGLILLIFASIIGNKIFDLHLHDFIRLALLGFFSTTLQYIFLYVGLANTTGVKASILNGSSVFFSVITAHFLYKNDRLNRYTVTGCLIGFLGVLAVNWGTGLFEWQFSINGEGFIVIATFLLAAAGIYGKKVSQVIAPAVMTGWQLFIGGAILTVTGTASGGSLTTFTPTGAALLIYMAFLSSAAFTLFALLMKYNPVSRISIYNFTIPIFGAVLSAIFLDEKILEYRYLAALALSSLVNTCIKNAFT